MPPVMNEIGTDYTLLKAAFDNSEVVFQFMSSKSEKASEMNSVTKSRTHVTKPYTPVTKRRTSVTKLF